MTTSSFPQYQNNPALFKTDLILITAAIALGFGIVFYNNVAPLEQEQTKLQQYMDRIITRMDAVGGQLTEWHAQDIRQ